MNLPRSLRPSHVGLWQALPWLLCALLCDLSASFQARAEQPWLWQIGIPDGKNAEFALAPNQSAKFKEDPLFIVGQSKAQADWPYVQPGPNDAWGGSRQHTFTILFALKAPPGAGECRLEVRLLDTHASSPPKLTIQINGRSFEQGLPAGGGDASIQGQIAKGRPHQF